MQDGATMLAEHHWIYVNGELVFDFDLPDCLTDPWLVAMRYAQIPANLEVRHIVKKQAVSPYDAPPRWEVPS